MNCSLHVPSLTDNLWTNIAGSRSYETVIDAADPHSREQRLKQQHMQQVDSLISQHLEYCSVVFLLAKGLEICLP